MQLFENEFISLSYDEEDQILTRVWTAQTAEMTDEDYKEILIKMLNLVIEYQVERLFSDATLFAFHIAPSLQEWTVENTTLPFIATGLSQKIAILTSEDFITSLSIEQIVDEYSQKGNSETKFFSSEEDAKKWLKT